MIISDNPSTLARAERGCQIMGFPATGKSGLGPGDQLSARSRIPFSSSPPRLEYRSADSLVLANLQSSDRGLIRVPFDGPPTKMTPFVTDMMADSVDVKTARRREGERRSALSRTINRNENVWKRSLAVIAGEGSVDAKGNITTRPSLNPRASRLLTLVEIEIPAECFAWVAHDEWHAGIAWPLICGGPRMGWLIACSLGCLIPLCRC